MKKLITLLSVAMLSFIPAENSNIKGSIGLSGKPIKDIDVNLKKVPGNEIVSATKTDEKGQFVFENIPAGKYEVVIKDIMVTPEKNKINGKIMINGEFLKKATVRFLNDQNIEIAETVSDNKGNFQFEGLPAGKISVLIQTGELN